jgi:hypothetical protein
MRGKKGQEKSKEIFAMIYGLQSVPALPQSIKIYKSDGVPDFKDKTGTISVMEHAWGWSTPFGNTNH